MPPRALVVGAGLGGFAAALALQRAGYEPHVFERAHPPRPSGASPLPPPLLLAPNGARALAELGALEPVLEHAARVERVELRDAEGRELNRFSLARAQMRAAAPALCVETAAVRDALVARLGDEFHVHSDCEAEGFTLESRGVTLRLNGEREEHGALLVGADGARSAVRELLLGSAAHPDAESATSWRGAAAIAEDVEDLPPGLLVQYVGSGGEAGMVRLDAERVYWYATVRGAADADADPTRAVRDPRWRRVVEATPSGAMRREVAFDAAPLSRWGEGRLTLLGDAAHPMLPTAVQGAAQALEDAVVLGRCLVERPQREAAAALRRYEELRMPRAAAVARVARRGSAMGLASGRVSMKLRDAAIRLVPGRVIAGRVNSLVDWEP